MDILMLKYGYFDIIYCNCMKIPVYDDMNLNVVCASIEDYVKCEQHRSYLISQVQAEDMKEERQLYGNVITCSRMTVT